MRITTRGRYGLRAMVELARGYGQGPMLMGGIADELGVSRKYLHSLLTALKSAELVQSARGSGGGYELAKPPEEINIADVMCGVEECKSLVACLEDMEICKRSPTCVARELWMGLEDVIRTYLMGITLQDLAERCKEPAADHHTEA